MGYSDQKYYDRKQIPMSDPVAFTGTFTASSATDRKSTRLNSSHVSESRMPSSA